MWKIIKCFVFILLAVFVFSSCDSEKERQKTEDEVKKIAEEFVIHALSELVTEEDEDFSTVDPVLGEDLIKFLKCRNEIIRKTINSPIPREFEVTDQKTEFFLIDIEEDKAFLQI